MTHRPVGLRQHVVNHLESARFHDAKALLQNRGNRAPVMTYPLSVHRPDPFEVTGFATLIRVDAHFQQLRAANTLSPLAVALLKTNGFLTIPGPLSGNGLHDLADAYDQVMAEACGPDLRIGSSTTRLSDVLSFHSLFDEVFLYAPLLEACSHLIGEPFKLSSFLARTLRAGTQAQELHADLPRTSEDAPLFGFILTVDAFREENGATRFVPGSHQWPDVPMDRLNELRAAYPGEILALGEPGTMILFNAAIWHGHTANRTEAPRRSIQGYFVRRTATQTFCFRDRLAEHVQARTSSLARYLLALDERPLDIPDQCAFHD